MTHKWLQNYLNGLKLTSREEVEHVLVSYFAWKLKEFTSIEFISLTDRIKLEKTMEVMLMINYFLEPNVVVFLFFSFIIYTLTRTLYSFRYKTVAEKIEDIEIMSMKFYRKIYQNNSIH